MARFWEIFTISLLFFLFVVSYIFIYQDNNLKKMDKLSINISNSDSVQLVTENDIKELLASENVRKLSSSYNNCDVAELEREVRKMTFVDSADVFKVTDGTINIKIVQKNIKVRIISTSGLDYYISDKGELLPTLSSYVADVPVVSCSDEFLKLLTEKEGENWRNEKKIEINYYFIQNLLNFVKLVESSPFWKSMIVQIKVNEMSEIELSTRVGNQRIILCDMAEFDKFELFLTKLKGFYHEILPANGWNKYSVINLKFNDIVVTTI